MATSAQTSEVLTHMTNTAVEIFTLFADANQKVLRELVDLSASAAKEGVRLYAELQSSAVEAVKDGQAFLLRRQAELQGAPADPAGSYQRGLLESVGERPEGAPALRGQCPGGDALGRAAAGQRRAGGPGDPDHLRPALDTGDVALLAASLAAPSLLQPLLEGAELLAQRRHLVAQGVRLAAGSASRSARRGGRRLPRSQPSPRVRPIRGTRGRPRAGSS